VLRELVEPLRERSQVLFEQTAARVLQEAPHDRERLELVRREPQPRQLKRLALPLSIVRAAVLVAARLRVEHHGRVELIPKRVDRAMQRGLRALEPRHQVLERNGSPARPKDRVELEDAVELVHGAR